MKGSTDDIVSSLAALFSFGVFSVIVLTISQSIGQISFFQSSFAWNQAATALSYVDYMAAFLQVAFFVLAIGFARRIRTNKVFLPISIAVLGIDVFLAAIFSDVYISMVTGSALASGANALSLWTLLLKNLPLMVLGLGIGVIAAMYSRIGSVGGVQASR